MPPQPAAGWTQPSGTSRRLAQSSTTIRMPAYAVLYDAARKAVTAVMLARGLRVRNALGAHAAVAEYAASELVAPAASELDRMRRFRNRIEYGSISFTAGQARYDLGNATAIVAAVREALDR